MAVKTSKQIGNEIESIKKQLEELEAQYKKAREEEFDAAVQDFMTLFLQKLDIRTKEDMEKVTRILAAIESVEKREEIEPDKPEEAAPPKKEDAMPQEKEADIPAEAAEEEPEPAGEKAKDADKEPESSEEGPAEEGKIAAADDDDFSSRWDEYFGGGSAIMPQFGDGPEEEAAPKEEEPAEEPKAEEAPGIDPMAVLAVSESNGTLASFKRSRAVTDAELILVKAIAAAVDDGSLKREDVMGTLFGEAEINVSSKNFFNEMDTALTPVREFFEDHPSSSGSPLMDEFLACKFNIRGKAFALAASDLASYLF